jgi:hypothetical protein
MIKFSLKRFNIDAPFLGLNLYLELLDKLTKKKMNIFVSSALKIL